MDAKLNLQVSKRAAEDEDQDDPFAVLEDEPMVNFGARDAKSKLSIELVEIINEKLKSDVASEVLLTSLNRMVHPQTITRDNTDIRLEGDFTRGEDEKRIERTAWTASIVVAVR